MRHSIKRKFGDRKMYDNLAAPAAAGIGSGTLAMTGAGEVFWLGLAGFAMLALGMAVKRIVPVRSGRGGESKELPSPRHDRKGSNT